MDRRVILRVPPANPNRIVLYRVHQIIGVTRLGSGGTVQPFARSHLHRTEDDMPLTGRPPILSDANGTYTFDVFNLDPYYVHSTKWHEYRADMDTLTADAEGSHPLTADVSQIAGVTANNLVGA